MERGLFPWHVQKGTARAEPLEEPSFAVAAATPGNPVTTKREVLVHIDERATSKQRKALETIVSGQVGGPVWCFGPALREGRRGAVRPHRVRDGGQAAV